MGEPFFWKAKNGWYLWTRAADGKRKRVFLGRTKKDAFLKWKEGVSDDPLFSTVAASWLSLQVKRRLREEVSASWLRRVTRTIEAFTRDYPAIRCSRVTPTLVRAWIGAASTAYEHTELSTLKQILRWAVDNGIIGKSSLATLRLSKGGRREVVLTIDQHRRLIAACRSPRSRIVLWLYLDRGYQSELCSFGRGEREIERDSETSMIAMP